VALTYAARRPRTLSEVWILDSQPGARVPEADVGSPTAVLSLLEAIPQPLPSRQAFRERVQPRLGRAIAEWLAMSLRAGNGGYRLTLDLAAIRALLDDYSRLDLWRAVEDPVRPGAIRFVVGGRSSVLSDADRRRLAESVPVYILERAGHWLHADDPEGLLAVMSGTSNEVACSDRARRAGRARRRLRLDGFGLGCVCDKGR